MTQPLFPPGPWSASGIRISAARLEGERLLVVDGLTPKTAGVAYVVYSDRTPRDHVESHAIQRLIAAAPELYEALRELEYSDRGICPQCAASRGCGHQSGCILGNALAKADGKESQ